MVMIEVCDDGPGFEIAASDGHGILNMRHRAEELGARLEITSGPTGTRVALALPSKLTATTQPPEAGVLQSGSHSEDVTWERADDRIDDTEHVLPSERGSLSS